MKPFIMKNVNCFVFKMENVNVLIFKGVFRKSQQSISQNSLILHL